MRHPERIGAVLVTVLTGAAGLAVPDAAAQSTNGAEGVAEVRGVVFDSTSMQTLGGARIAVIGTSVVGWAEDDGRFRLENVPAGTYWISFYHERLQELGVSPPSRQMEFSAGATIDLQLAVPSEETLLMGWCLAEQPDDRFGAVAGVVTDSLTGVAMPRAIVTAEPISRLPGIPSMEVRADESGYYRLCSIRSDVDYRLQAHFGRNTGRSVEVGVEAGDAVLQDLMLLMSAEGTLTGYVRDYISGDPVTGAQVSVAGTESSTLTDVTGRFVLDDLPPGQHLVTTDHIGFEARTDSVTVFSEETVDIEVRMATEALEVEGLVVTARTRFGRTSLAGDAKRADFISREEIDALLPRVQETTDLLRNMRVPGLRIRDVLQEDPLTGVRIPGFCVEVRRTGGEGCIPAAVVLNNVILPTPDQILRDLDPNIIDRIEILSPIDAQFQYGQQARNGAVVIFTR